MFLSVWLQSRLLTKPAEYKWHLLGRNVSTANTPLPYYTVQIYVAALVSEHLSSTTQIYVAAPVCLLASFCSLIPFSGENLRHTDGTSDTTSDEGVLPLHSGSANIC